MPSALLALCVAYAQASVITARDTQPDTVPACLSILPDGRWDGIDGSWSSFKIEIGTPPQDVYTFVSWSVYQTWAVIDQGCTGASNYSACAEIRGGIFNESASSTFDHEGTYDLWSGRSLGLYGDAVYGLDTVSLQGPDGGGPTLKDTLVGGFALEDFYMGIFGINPKPTNFSSFSDGTPSYMTLLKEQKYIPSVSFGYTAGAQYRSDTSFASLTLGGYDTSKFAENDLTWHFAPDNSRDVVVAIQSINTPSEDSSSPIGTELLIAPIYAYLDALVAEIWLPVESCKVFESVFGLQYDNDSELYLVNQTQHQNLVERNASITFQLGISTDSAETVSIELPYAAFDLTATSPYQSITNDSYYFPLRRAANETQYWIGRTFFQEAYISVDYERQKFNVSQRSWDASAPTHLVPITSYTGEAETSGGSGSSSNSLSGGAIAGIVVGAVAAIALLALLLICLLRRRSRRPRKDEHEKLGSDAGSTNRNTSPSRQGQVPNVFPKAELEGSTPPPRLEEPILGSGALFSNDSGSGTGTPRTPNALSGATFVPPRGLSASDSPTAESAEEGTGTQSSIESGSGTGSSGTRNTGLGTGSGTMLSLVSPISPGSAGEASEADSQERKLYEMPGDAPVVREKDGKELTEKEACAHREKLYNGVESPVDPQGPASVPNFSRSSLQGPRRVNPEDVATTNTVLGQESEPTNATRHRAFSFEEDRSRAENTEELYQKS